MNFFKKPAVAVILAVLLCGGILSFNTQSKLGEEIDAVEDSFFTTSTASGAYTPAFRRSSRPRTGSGPCS